jgi:hypothetical protein
VIIEVQCGSYLGEDDIVRFDDQYGRVRAGLPPPTRIKLPRALAGKPARSAPDPDSSA